MKDLNALISKNLKFEQAELEKKGLTQVYSILASKENEQAVSAIVEISELSEDRYVDYGEISTKRYLYLFKENHYSKAITSQRFECSELSHKDFNTATQRALDENIEAVYEDYLQKIGVYKEEQSL